MFCLFNESFANRKNAKKHEDEEPVQKFVDQMLDKIYKSFYRQLARTWHPDLEQDYKQRVLKESLIKQLTIAYKNNDLSELLSLEVVEASKKKDYAIDSKITSEMLLGYRHVQGVQFDGYGFDVVSKITVRYGPLKHRVRLYKNPIRAIQVQKC